MLFFGKNTFVIYYNVYIFLLWNNIRTPSPNIAEYKSEHRAEFRHTPIKNTTTYFLIR